MLVFFRLFFFPNANDTMFDAVPSRATENRCDTNDRQQRVGSSSAIRSGLFFPFLRSLRTC